MPSDLEVPVENTVFLEGHDVSTQNYICLPSAASVAWTCTGPQATWLDNHARSIITHFLSPHLAAVELSHRRHQDLPRSLDDGPGVGAEQDLAHQALGELPQRGRQLDGLAARGEWLPARQHGRPTLISRLGDLFGFLAAWDLDSFLDANSARKYYKDLRVEHEGEHRRSRHLQADPERDIYLILREPDLKNAALYVDLHASGKVMSPTNRVEERDARVSILGLEYFFEEYAALPTVVGDAQRWRDFAERVRNGLPDTDTP